MILLVAGLALFFAVHSVRMVAPAWREGRIAAIGENAWKGTYSVLSLAALVQIVWGYANAQPTAPVLYVASFGLVHATLLLTALAFVSLMVANLPAGRLKPLIRHPMLAAVILWSGGHLLVNGDLASVLLFGSFFLWSLVNRVAVAFRPATPPATGPVRNDVAAVVSGLAIWAAIVWFLHPWIAGVPVPIG
jgi:uncharacterized membrane protein